MALFIKNIEYLTMADGPQTAFGSIRIENELISAIGQIEPQASDEIIDGKHLLAMPGLVNSHNHAAMTLLRSYADNLPLMEWLNNKIFPAEARLSAEDIYIGNLLAHLEMIKGGTTCYADMYFNQEQAVRACEQSGMRASLSLGTADNLNNFKEKLSDSLRFCENYNNSASGLVSVMLGPHAPYTCSQAYLRGISELALEKDLPIHIHIAETQNEQNIIQQQTGMKVIPYLNSLGMFEAKVLAAHMVYVSAEDIELLLGKKVGASICTQSEMKLASGIAPVPAYLNAGITVGLGTDGASSNNDLDMWEEMRTTALLHKVERLNSTVITPYETLSMATSGSARCLFLDQQIGTLKAGKKADIILLNTLQPHFYPRNDMLSQLVYCAHASDVETVIINGKIVMKNRQCLTLDEEKILFAAEHCAKKILTR
ncbi:MAG: amidohydrolase [Clostridia bacterium]|nr:amidohydrolase [Clostridia bacterium]MDD4798746.1 amidohydrolase [Clostridia bacterium]